jgi:ferrous iron transport protein B
MSPDRDVDCARKIAIVGLPNTGKSQIFNNLTGDYTLVANYPLTTIDLKKTECAINDELCEVIDTPGLHCLYIHSEEELVVRDMLLAEKPNVIVQCIDANQLKQSLSLTADLLEMEMPLVVSMNAIDETARRGIWMDSKRLADLLGAEVVESIAISGKGTKRLKKAILNAPECKSTIVYPKVVESAIASIGALLPKDISYKRNMSLLILQKDSYLIDFLTRTYGETRTNAITREAERIRDAFRGDMGRVINHVRSRWIEDIAEKVTRRQDVTPVELSRRFAGLSRHPVFGIPILLLFMGIIYFLVVDVASAVAGWMEAAFWFPVENWILDMLPVGILRDFLIGDYGILSLGLANAVITILPILTIFFLAFSILEDIGYIPNISVLLKRIFEKIGLSGAAIIPMVLAFGCKTMAVLTTRSLASQKEKYIAIFLITLGIPCGAKMSVNMAVVGRMGAGALLIAFLALILVDAAVGVILNRLIPRAEKSYFIQELPEIRLPSPKAVVKKTYYRLYWFFKEAVPVFIYAATALFIADRIWLLDGLKWILSPLIEGFMGFPSEMLDTIILCAARAEIAAGMMIKLIDKGQLNYIQCVVAVLLMMMIPCVTNIGAVFREIKGRPAAVMTVSMYILAFLVAGIFNQMLVFFRDMGLLPV